MIHKLEPVIAIVPAAGVGKRMKAHCPKQYLKVDQLTVIERTVNTLLQNKTIDHVIVVISEEDGYFGQTNLAENSKVTTVFGGKERVDSVLAGLLAIPEHSYQWCLVHDAARPCVLNSDIDMLIEKCQTDNIGGLLAYPVRDTMKRSTDDQLVEHTVTRDQLWHALTPQMYKVSELTQAIEHSLINNLVVTDESSAIEALGLPSQLIESSSDNIKITRPDDLAHAQFILSHRRSVISGITLENE